MTTCPDCKGYGRITCYKCNGTGHLQPSQSMVLEKARCHGCAGSGEVVCPTCKGGEKISSPA